jgi:Schlafen, AlbA_2
MQPVLLDYKTASLLLTYLLLGALIGLFGIYPLTMVIVWLEFASQRPEGPALAEFMQERFFLGFIPRLLHLQIALSFAALGSVMGIGFGLFTRSYFAKMRELRFLENERKRYVPDLIQGGENARVEFKSSVRWDVQEARINRSLEKVIAKTLAGFLNARGGDLIVGIADDGSALGLDADYKTLKHQNADGFERLVTDLVKKYLGGDLCTLVHMTFTNYQSKEIVVITAQEATRPVYVADGKSSAFYVRAGNSTRQLDVREALDYAANRW